jgi:uncharacterized membrane-anchored protein
MDQAVTQWINSFAGSNALLDDVMISATKTGVPLLIVLVAAQWWSKIDRTHVRHTCIAAGLSNSIVTTRREAFYWLTILFTFALGTAAGDLTAEKLKLGYLISLILFAGLIAIITVAHYAVKGLLDVEHKRQSTNAVLAFWLAYILTRPLGASIGDYLSQSQSEGGLGLGPTVTSSLFLATILALVVFLTVTRADDISPTKTK